MSSSSSSSSSSSNKDATKFHVLSEEFKKHVNKIVISIPDYAELYSAMEHGECWYDSDQTGKKRKRPVDLNGISRDIKKARYD